MLTILLTLFLFQVPIATFLDSIRWDYNDSDIALYAIDGFKVCYDSQLDTTCRIITLTSKFIPTANQGGVPPIGVSAYKTPIVALTPGNHTVNIFACHLDVCSDSLTMSFTYSVKIPSPTNIIFIKGNK